MQTKTNHVQALHDLAEKHEFEAVKGRAGWHITAPSGERLTPAESGYDAQQAHAWLEGFTRGWRSAPIAQEDPEDPE